MDYFCQDSAHVTNSISLNEPAGSTLEDKATHKRWVRGLRTFYACLFLAAATLIGFHQTMSSSSSTEQHASLRTDVRSAH